MADAQPTKTCCRCHQSKQLTDFKPDNRKKDGRVGTCRDCAKPLLRKYWLESKHYRETQRAYARSPAGRAAKRRRAIRGRYKSKYGMTLADYDAMLTSQGHACAICRKDTPGGRWSRFHVDHDHATGVVRGLLCVNCNWTLGRLGDSLERVMRFTNYLQQRREGASDA